MGLLQRRDLPAKPAAQVIVAFQLIDIGAVRGHPAHLGHSLPMRGDKADDNAVGNDKGGGLGNAIGTEKTLNGLLYPVDLGATPQKSIAQIGGHRQKLAIIHDGFLPFGFFS